MRSRAALAGSRDAHLTRQQRRSLVVVLVGGRNASHLRRQGFNRNRLPPREAKLAEARIEIQTAIGAFEELKPRARRRGFRQDGTDRPALARARVERDEKIAGGLHLHHHRAVVANQRI
jgi:hypothetical protein